MKKIIFTLLITLCVLSGCGQINKVFGSIPATGETPYGFQYNNESDLPDRSSDFFGSINQSMSACLSSSGTVTLDMAEVDYETECLRYYNDYYYTVCKVLNEDKKEFFQFRFYNKEGILVSEYTLDKLYSFGECNIEINKTSIDDLKKISPYEGFYAIYENITNEITLQFFGREITFVLEPKNGTYFVTDYFDTKSKLWYKDCFVISEHILPKDLDMLVK